jgi:hypothetical protein
LPHEKIRLINNLMQNATEICLTTGYDTVMNKSIYANFVVKYSCLLSKNISPVFPDPINDLRVLNQVTMTVNHHLFKHNVKYTFCNSKNEQCLCVS